MHKLKLQFVLVAELRVIRLAAEQRFGAQINFIIQRAFSIHDCVKLLSVHGRPPDWFSRAAVGNLSVAGFAARRIKNLVYRYGPTAVVRIRAANNPALSPPISLPSA